ncbi:MAG: DNA-binding domain-containing protein [Luteimonas sp.]
MNEHGLAGLQRQFLARLRGQSRDGLETSIAPGRMPRDIGIGIYAHAYGARLREALEHDHPVLGAYLGDALWDTLCNGYIAAHPSRHRSLRDFGNDLPDYLTRTDAFSAHPEIAELAAFERCLLDSFDAADETRAEWDRLLDLPEGAWPRLRLRFHPSLRTHHVARNAIDIWTAIKRGNAPPQVHVATATDWVVWRDAERVSRFRSLDAEESTALAYSLHGGDFSGLCAQLLATREAETVPHVALNYLNAWCAEGWIARWD